VQERGWHGQDVATEACLKVVDEVTRIWEPTRLRTSTTRSVISGMPVLVICGGTHEILKDFLGRLLIGRWTPREEIPVTSDQWPVISGQ